MPKRKRTAKKSNKNWFVASAVITLIVLFAVAILVSNDQGGLNKTPTQVEKETSTIISSGDICISNLQCFSASCKSTPSVWECLNSTSQETYYKNCKSYTDVNVVQDFSRCMCIQERCTAVR
jgi:hypothetical protein